MSFLPIVARELREGSRRRGTFGTRMKMAGWGTLAFAVCFLISLANPLFPFVKILFWGLSWICMLYCLLAGRLMTADCLSSEKREGTLGLLFLTDLKGYDVVLGKLAATSLNGFYGLMAVFPLLAIPLLAGGLANGEFWRMILVLINTFLFSAAIGLFASSVCRDERKTMGVNLALLLLLAAAPPAMFRWWLSCPVYSFWMCADVHYKSKFFHKDFLESIGITFGLTVILLLLACWKTPRSWQDLPKPARALRRKDERRRRKGNVKRAALFRRRALDRNAYFWLAARPYFKASSVWLALLFPAGLWAVGAVQGFFEEANPIFMLLAGVMLKLWMTTEAGRQFAEDKKSGAFELLLSTPLTTRDITRGQRQALRRQFLLPSAAAVVAGLLSVLFVVSRRNPDTIQEGWVWLAAILMFMADMVALGWFGMWTALSAKSHGRGTIKTVLSILVLPWVLFGLAELAAHLFMFLFVRHSWDPSWRFDLGCWFGVGIFVDIFLTVKAWRGLRNRFVQLAREPLAPKRRLAWLRDWWTGSPQRKAQLRLKWRRAVAAVAILLTLGVGAVLWDLHLARVDIPKPLIISISRSNNPVRVAAGRAYGQNGFLFVLPDGTLWTWVPRGLVTAPRQIGTNQVWVQASLSQNAFALRSDGTIWTWPLAGGEPRPFGTEHDWVEVCVSENWFIGRKRNGGLWTSAEPRLRDADMVHGGHDWRAVNANSGAIFAVRADGTLWAWGQVNYISKSSWLGTNYQAPTQVCRESNWIGFNATLEEGARNQAGESWSLATLQGVPSAAASISSMARLVSSNAAMVALGPFFTSNWIYAQYELRSDGTLWASPWIRITPYYISPASRAPAASPVRVGERTDWVAIWGTSETMIGMTSDGTLWTWGSDYGQESHWVTVFVDRFREIKEMIEAPFGVAPVGVIYALNSYGPSDDYPWQREPRPLMRLTVTQSFNNK